MINLKVNLNRFLKIIFCFIFILLFFMPLKIFAYSDYTIRNYNIDIILNENNSFRITETITANFDVSRHKLLRKIPLKNCITSLDGTTFYNNAEISNINVNTNYSTYTENDYLVIEIGSSNLTISGLNTFKISYTYDIGRETLRSSDKIQLTLIGSEWNTTVNNITFAIKMPESFDESSLSFLRNSTNISNVSYTVNENIITGYVTDYLNADESLSVKFSLPQEYLTSNNIDKFSIFVILLSLIFVLIADRLWLKYGKDDKIIETIESYPPKGYNSLELGFLYNENVDNINIISLLPYLAQKGYLQFEKDDKDTIFSDSTGFKIGKLKNYDGFDDIEKTFFNGLFFNSRNSVNASDLYNIFYKTLNKIKIKFNALSLKNKLFEPLANKKIKWLVLMILSIFVLITIKPVSEFAGTEALISALFFPCIGFSVLLALVFGKTSNAIKIFGIIFGLIVGGVPWLYIVSPVLIQNSMYFITYIVGIICIGVLLIFVKIMPKRTDFANEIIGQIRGFKKFMETAKKQQLEDLVKENPNYFYDILPYAYSLGVSDIWMKHFDSIPIKKPDWFCIQADFSFNDFTNFMHNAMNSISFAMESNSSNYSFDFISIKKDSSDDNDDLE